MEIITVIALLILLGINYYVFKGDVIAPAFIYTLTFVISFIDVLLNLNIWKTSISFETMLIVLLGVAVFSATSIIYHLVYTGMRETPITISDTRIEVPELQVEKWKLVAFFVFQCIVIFFMQHYVKILTAPYGTDGSLSSAISMYQHLSKFTTLKLNFPKLLTYSYVFSSSSSFVWGYIAIHNLFFFKKVNIGVIANLIISLIGSFLTGSRGVAVQAIVCLIVIYIMYYRDSAVKISMRKVLMKPMILLVLILVSFKYFAALLGRDHSLGLFEYISVYLGAPIKNFDTFLHTNIDTQNPVWGYNTFTMQWDWISKAFNLNVPKNTINTDFLYSNGHNLGNVFTAYKDYITDFGFGGAIVCIVVIAVVMGALYEYTRSVRKSGKLFKIDWVRLVYGYLLFSVGFTFFSNKFYQAFTVTFVQRVFCWIILGYFFCDVVSKKEGNKN